MSCMVLAWYILGGALAALILGPGSVMSSDGGRGAGPFAVVDRRSHPRVVLVVTLLTHTLRPALVYACGSLVRM